MAQEPESEKAPEDHGQDTQSPVSVRPIQEPSFRLADYRDLEMKPLQEAATVAGLQDFWQLDRRQLVFALQTHCASTEAVGRGDGILELHPEGFGFLRSVQDDGRAGADDIYVSPKQIHRLRLRPGQLITGLIRPPREGERFFALLRVETVDGRPVNPRAHRVPFVHLPPVLPHRRLDLAGPGTPVAARAIDLLAPLAFGQRVLLRTPPSLRRTGILADLALGIATNHPNTRLLALSVDQSPEEQADLRQRLRTIDGAELFASAFDESAIRHVALINLVLARVRRLVEDGDDVVLLVDSLTSLVRSFNVTVPHSGKIITAGLDANALQLGKQLYCCARQTEAGGSLTIVATLMIDPESPMSAAVAEEFADRASATITFDEQLVRARLVPPIRLSGSSSRWPDHYLDERARTANHELRQTLADDSDEVALRRILTAIAATPDNASLTPTDLSAPAGGS